MSRWLVIGCGATLLVSSVFVRAQAPQAQAAPPAIDFTRDIQPIFERSCAECHGPTTARARLRLHAPQFIRRGGQSGPVFTPGKSGNSLLIHRVLEPSTDDRMPLDADPLPEAAIARLRAWIDQGALMPDSPAADAGDEHWAYVKPVRPEVPPVTNVRWVRNPIDRFVLARLEREQLSPAPEASRAALLRRVTLDLTGLPPTPAELDAFLIDTSPDAYEKVVDRLLASPHYGERWARPWLDLARYADTNGHEKDNRRAIWKYRDWVIDALNRDLPFDTFTIEQLAGDMLPNATTEQKIASGFHRNAMTNEEGGVDPEESRYEVLVDRVNTTATVWLGTTLACAQCHNHKYDPFSQKDYFRFLAFFANSDFDSRTFGDGTRYFEPTLDLASADQEKARKETQAKIDQIDQELRTVTPAIRDAQEKWEMSIRSAYTAWTPLAPRQANATNGVVLTIQPDGSVLASGPNPPLTSYTLTAETTLQGVTAVRLETLPDASLPRSGPGRDGYGHFRVTGIRVEAAPLTESNIKSEPARSVRFETLKVDDSATPFEPGDLLGTTPLDAARGASLGTRPLDSAQRASLGTRPAAGGYARKSGSWAINAMRGGERLARHAVLAAASPFGFAGGTRITVRIDHLDGTIGQGIGRFRVSLTTQANPLDGADLAPRLRRVLDVPAAERTRAQAEEIAGVFRATSPLLRPTRDALAAARKSLTDLQIPSTLVMRERASFERPSFELRRRGSFEARGERVYAATPGGLPPLRNNQPVNRLGLARWLVDPDNPLVSRVAVNRLWEQIFGRGLVETSEDFGTRGTPPTHPELLDWLATEFSSKGWRQKALIRTIVLSATYRQSSAVPTALVDRDPDNRWFARGPRVRMEAEMIRDVALAASGLLSPKMHGPSVFPMQPDGVWNIPYNADKWTTSAGEDRYRRSLYTFWRRTSPYPSFMTFDATSREFCTVRRVRTNTPLQALTLLNDPASFDAAKALAGRMMQHAGGGETGGAGPGAVRAQVRARVAFGIKLVLSRDAKPAELDRVVSLYEQELRYYRARRTVPAAELSAWTMVANVLLNLDEAVTK